MLRICIWNTKNVTNKKDMFEGCNIYPRFDFPIFYYYSSNITNSMTIIYSIINNMEKIRLFGDEFVKNNFDKCKILTKYAAKNITSELILDDEQKKQNILKIYLLAYAPITKMNYCQI